MSVRILLESLSGLIGMRRWREHCVTGLCLLLIGGVEFNLHGWNAISIVVLPGGFFFAGLAVYVILRRRNR